MKDILTSSVFLEDTSEHNIYDLLDKIGYEFYSFDNGLLTKLDCARDYFKWKTSKEPSLQIGPAILIEQFNTKKTVSFLLFCGAYPKKKLLMDLFYVQSTGGRFDGLAEFFPTYDEALEVLNNIKRYYA